MTPPPSTSYDCFDVEIADHIAHLRMSRPEAMNSMIPSFWTELPAIVRNISDNALARCIVISSTGRHFSAGMDLSAFAPGAADGRPVDPPIAAERFRTRVKALQDAFSCLESARTPVLVAVQGGCVGGGVDLASACDVRYATRDAFFCIQEINIGMVADVGTFPRLCKLVPEGYVRELAYTGRRLGAERAVAIGLVNEVFDSHEAMMSHVMETAREIASKAPLAVTGSKVMINYARDHTVRDGLDYVALWNAGMFAPPQMQEAFQAKREGRAGVFPDLAPLQKGA